jgi:hypothetical protein
MKTHSASSQAIRATFWLSPFVSFILLAMGELPSDFWPALAKTMAVITVLFLYLWLIFTD